MPGTVEELRSLAARVNYYLEPQQRSRDEWSLLIN